MSTPRTATCILFIFLAACTMTSTDRTTDWNARATAGAGFAGAGANAVARSGAGGTTVTVAFRDAHGMSDTVRPWHVHFGTCGNDQGIVGDANLYSPLRPGPDGRATASATIPMSLSADKSYFVNIHKSPSELQTIVACGQLNTGTPSP